MFRLQEVLEAQTPADATARYWVWRASGSNSAEARSLFRSKLLQGAPDVTGADAGRDTIIDSVLELQDTVPPLAGMLATYHALLSALKADLQEDDPSSWGVTLQTDYDPIGRLREALKGIDSPDLPAKTITHTYPEFAYAGEQGRLTVIHGDLDIARSHIVDRHSRVEPVAVVQLS